MFVDKTSEQWVRNNENTFFATSDILSFGAPPEWLNGERVGLLTWWLRVRSPVEATFLSGIFSPLTSAEACEKSSRWLWKDKLCYYWCEKARKHICVTDLHDMTLGVKVALNLNTTYNLSLRYEPFPVKRAKLFTKRENLGLVQVESILQTTK